MERKRYGKFRYVIGGGVVESIWPTAISYLTVKSVLNTDSDKTRIFLNILFFIEKVNPQVRSLCT